MLAATAGLAAGVRRAKRAAKGQRAGRVVPVAGERLGLGEGFNSSGIQWAGILRVWQGVAARKQKARLSVPDVSSQAAAVGAVRR